MIVGTEGFHVYMQNIDSGLVEGIATRFTAGVNCLALNKDKTRLLAGSRLGHFLFLTRHY